MIFLRNILRTKARTLMTLFGIAGGIGVFVGISSMTADLRGQVGEVTSAYNSDVVIQSRKAAAPFSSKIKPAQMEQLRSLFGEALSPLVLGSLREEWSAYVILTGAPPALASRIPLLSGAPFTPGRPEAMMGVLCAERLRVEPGGEFTLGGESYRVSGIFRTGSRLLDGGLMLDIPLAQRLLGKEGLYSLALVQAGSTADSARVIEQVRTEVPGLKAMRSMEFAGAIRLFRTVDTFARAVAAIALIGACVIVTNTLLMAVSERTREIGILMAVGWKPWLVLRMLLAESLTLCLLGAGLGNLLGMGLLYLLNRSQSIGFGWIPVSITPQAFASSFAVTLLLAVASLIWPAVVVLRLHPAEALRHE